MAASPASTGGRPGESFVGNRSTPKADRVAHLYAKCRHACPPYIPRKCIDEVGSSTRRCAHRGSRPLLRIACATRLRCPRVIACYASAQFMTRSRAHAPARCSSSKTLRRSVAAWWRAASPSASATNSARCLSLRRRRACPGHSCAPGLYPFDIGNIRTAASMLLRCRTQSNDQVGFPYFKVSS